MSGTNDPFRSKIAQDDSDANATGNNTRTFPMRLYQMLEDSKNEGFEDIVSWMPDGNGFTVYKRQKFEDEIMTRYFRLTKYKSFNRQVNLYEFKRSKRGSYCHEKFVRGKFELCCQMRRPPTKDTLARRDSAGSRGRQEQSQSQSQPSPVAVPSSTLSDEIGFFSRHIPQSRMNLGMDQENAVMLNQSTSAARAGGGWNHNPPLEVGVTPGQLDPIISQAIPPDSIDQMIQNPQRRMDPEVVSGIIALFGQQQANQTNQRHEQSLSSGQDDLPTNFDRV